MTMQELAMALRDRDYETAQAIQLDLHTNKLDQCGQWMVSSIVFLRVRNDLLNDWYVGRSQALDQHESRHALGELDDR